MLGGVALTGADIATLRKRWRSAKRSARAADARLLRAVHAYALAGADVDEVRERKAAYSEQLQGLFEGAEARRTARMLELFHAADAERQEAQP